MNPLFTAEQLRAPLARFRLSQFADLRAKQALLGEWIAQLKSGKLTSLKEEEVKSRFVTDFFGEVLGFNSGNSRTWQLREELRTKVDATKADAALGYFSTDRATDICRAVIEIKDAATELDARQKRPDPKSAVDQAFEYAPKMRGECRWVIVSNFREIRFYWANDRSRYQHYLLAELAQEEKLKELLLLFHKDRFITRIGESRTDKLLHSTATPVPVAGEQHVVDELYQCLQRFEGLNFVNPNYLASLYPFNILNQHVWHYQDGTLLTLNPHICWLLEGLSVQDNQLVLSEALHDELVGAGVTNYEHKLAWTIRYLNRCHITYFKAVRDYQAIDARHKNTIGFSYRHMFYVGEQDGIEKELDLSPKATCQCLICLYRRLDLTAFLEKLKSAAGYEEYYTLEYAYGNYLAATNNYRTAHDIYLFIERQAKNQQDQGVTYFLAKQNRLHLHNLLQSSYFHDDQEQLLANIRDIDLISVISDELEGEIHPEVRKYLLDIERDDLAYKVQDELDERITRLLNRQRALMRGGTYQGPDDLLHLWYQYDLLYRHINLNYFVYDGFTKYRSLAKRLFEAALIGYSIPEADETRMHEYFVREAIFHINSRDLAGILKKTKKLVVAEQGRQDLLSQTRNLLKSFYQKGIFNAPYATSLLQEFLLNRRFEENITDIFSNLFIILARLRLTVEDVNEMAEALAGFLSVETVLGWSDVEHLAFFLQRKGKLFTQAHLHKLLELVLLENRVRGNRYQPLIPPIVEALYVQYPDFKITEKSLIRKVVANCYSGTGVRAGFKHLAQLHRITDSACTTYLRAEFQEYLNEHFDTDLYRSLLWHDALAYDEHTYFAQWVQEVAPTAHRSFGGFQNGNPQFQNYTFLNFALLIYEKNIPFDTTALQQLTDLPDFESWLIRPDEFDYELFDVNWLTVLRPYKAFFTRLRTIAPLHYATKHYIENNFNPDVYTLYNKHLQPGTEND
ncbi:hypothetical protein MTX78_25005 (plasmid) [Hymenobacter tibetensis]|uniref:MmeI-like N-terminal domain-containing protein n=1 Tax=Hymenobacter tibetensis TaxID=497967 RepID=A0ABY4D7T6_9BACT|nr:type IIL restriction-modification enzyme MmeI [Hymenobacter tibetensis]UOG77625.1 hypothetical protein MTX78_25005 [Hymenobacter tibetensis]